MEVVGYILTNKDTYYLLVSQVLLLSTFLVKNKMNRGGIGKPNNKRKDFPGEKKKERMQFKIAISFGGFIIPEKMSSCICL